MRQFHLKEISINVLPMQTRFPFKYGIASMTHLPHLFISATIEIGAQKVNGIASEGFPPKWFTKISDTTFEQDLVEELKVIQSAASIALELGLNDSFFQFWFKFYHKFKDSWAPKGVPPLLANFALSLIERAALDAYIKAHKTTLHEAIFSNLFDIKFGQVHPELASTSIDHFINPKPLGQCHIRHTVGLGDPLIETDISEGSRPNDNLPFTLIENIRQYQLSYFKLKLSGNSEIDCPRMEAIARLLDQELGDRYFITLDGNEQFEDFDAFRSAWDLLQQNSHIEKMLNQNLILVEQPVHRSNALASNIKNQLEDWTEAPSVIIDEADGDLESLPTALNLGYCGTSHKNCKGIIKGLINAAYLDHWSDTHGSKTILSGEDLANVGPIALLQDLAMMNVLGIDHVERNGHHYFNGLSMLPKDLQDLALSHHSDLYNDQGNGIPTLSISDGKIATQSLNKAPFGSAIPIEPSRFQSLDEWINSDLS